MYMVDRKLTKALENLVSRGELSQEDAAKVELEYTNSNAEDGSRRKVLSEVGGYLGGLFILTGLLILFSERWRHISRMAQFSIFLTISLLLFAASLLTGKSTNSRSRLAGLLGVVSSICATLAIIDFRANGNSLTTFAILVGWTFTLCSFFLFRTIIGELSLAGFSIALGFSSTDHFLSHLHNSSHVAAFVLGTIGVIWLYLAQIKFFNRSFGDAVAMGMLFFSGQLTFRGNFHVVTYLICIAIAVVASWLYSHSPEWPLLVGGIAAITVGTGEFVSSTLGGSLGAALGLLTSGIFFVVGSIYSLKRSKRTKSEPE